MPPPCPPRVVTNAPTKRGALHPAVGAFVRMRGDKSIISGAAAFTPPRVVTNAPTKKRIVVLNQAAVLPLARPLAWVGMGRLLRLHVAGAFAPIAARGFVTGDGGRNRGFVIEATLALAGEALADEKFEPV